MNLKNIALVSALIAAPAGTTAAVASKYKKPETPVVQKAPEYQLSAQDYKAYVLPHVLNSSNTNNVSLEALLKQINDKFLGLSDEKRDSILNVVETKADSVANKFAEQMDSLQNIAQEKIDELSLINTYGYKTTDLNKPLVKAAIEEGNIIQLYTQINDIDKATNGDKAVELNLPDKNFSEVTDSVLGMSLAEFTDTYERELWTLKDKKIPKELPLGAKPVELTEKEQFVLDKIEELENAVNEHYAMSYLTAQEHSATRAETTFNEVESAMDKLTEFSDTKDEKFNIVKFSENESAIVVKPFLEELQKIDDTTTSINNVKIMTESSTRKILQDGKVIIEVTNLKDGSVKKFTAGGQRIQ